MRLPLFTASWPDYGKEWDFVDVSLCSHASRIKSLIQTGQSVWSEMKWPAQAVELFHLDERSTMADLLHALDEFRNLLRTKFS